MNRVKRRIIFISLTALFCLLALSFFSPHTPPPGMVLIPAGNFFMGTDQVDEKGEALNLGLPHPWYEDEHPKHQRHIPAFYLDQYEVTNTRYQSFVKATGHPPSGLWGEAGFPPDKAEHPVVFVNWHDAMTYCQWAKKRLPTEAEWEKAARGPKGLQYPWGNTFEPDRANISAKPSLGGGSTVPMGQYKEGQSPYGVYDLIGNVWEWTDSTYDPYPNNTAQISRFGKGLKVSRGLSFMSIGHYPPELYHQVISIVARGSFRSFDMPSSKLPDVGFRCAQDAS